MCVLHACVPLFKHLRPLVSRSILGAAMCKLREPLILWFIELLRLPRDRHQSAAALNVFRSEFMSTCLSPRLLLSPLENSLTKRFCASPCIRAAIMKGIIHYKVFDLRMIYRPFPRRNKEWKTFLEISCEFICDIQRTSKGLKLCMGFIDSVRPQRSVSIYQMWNFHNRVRRHVSYYDPRISGSFSWCVYRLWRKRWGPIIASASDTNITRVCVNSRYPLRCSPAAADNLFCISWYKSAVCGGKQDDTCHTADAPKCKRDPIVPVVESGPDQLANMKQLNFIWPDLIPFMNTLKAHFLL